MVSNYLLPTYAILDPKLITTVPEKTAAACGIDAMSHPVSAYFDVPHGVANAILLPTVAEFNSTDADPENTIIFMSVSVKMRQVMRNLRRICWRPRFGC